ncbi:MAG: flagellar biosynthetic protein FliO [Acidobacteriaceae bacterium]
MFSQYKRGQRKRQMSLVETLSLGGKRQLMLVECAGQCYLVGCANEVQMIVPVLPQAGSYAAHESAGQSNHAQPLYMEKMSEEGVLPISWHRAGGPEIGEGQA